MDCLSESPIVLLAALGMTNREIRVGKIGLAPGSPDPMPRKVKPNDGTTDGTPHGLEPASGQSPGVPISGVLQRQVCWKAAGVGIH